MSYTLSVSLALGSSQTGLTLKAQLIDTAGADVGGEVATGFVELGSGNYLWTYAGFPDAFRGGVKFYTGVAPGTLKAFAGINPEEAEYVNSRLPAALVSGRIDSSVGAMATDVSTAAALKADAVAEIQAGLALQSSVDDLEGRLTATRAGYLDNLAGGAVALEATLGNATYGLAALKALIDAIDTSTELAARFTELKGAGWMDETLKALGDLLDAIKTKSDSLAFTSGNVHAHLKAKDSTLGLSTQEKADAGDATWDEAQSGHTIAGTFGKYLDSQISTIASNITTLLNRIGAFTGSGVNTILGFLKAMMQKDLTAPSDVGGTYDPGEDSLEAISDRVQTTGFTIVDEIIGNNVSKRRGDTWSVPFTGDNAIGDITGYSKLWLTIKRAKNNADGTPVPDTESILQFLLSNPPDAGDGLQYLNKAAVDSADKSKGSLTVSDVGTGAVTVALDATVTDDLNEAYNLVYDWQVLISGAITTKKQGNWNIVSDVTRAVS